MIKKLNNILNQLHPGYSDLSVYFRTINFIALGVFFVLIIFQPPNFGRRLLFDSLWFTAFINTSCCYLTMLLCVLWIKLFPGIFAPERWTLKREFGIIFYQMTSITFSIWLLNSFLGFYDFRLKEFGKSFFTIFFTGIIPYMIVTFIRHIYLLRRGLKEAQKINSNLLKETGLEPQGFLNCQQLLNSVEVQEFYYAESRGNDLHLFCIKCGEVMEYKIRYTLRRFAKENADHKNLFRCHRSYIINTDKILHVSGNAATYQVLLNKAFPLVPVSRSYISAFRRKLESEH